MRGQNDKWITQLLRINIDNDWRLEDVVDNDIVPYLTGTLQSYLIRDKRNMSNKWKIKIK